MSQTVENLTAIHLDPVTEEVVRALENPKYVWRTPQGISEETGVPETAVTTVLSQIPPDVLAVANGRQGRLYTTRSHYYKTQSFWGRFLTAATGQFK
jgi:hypothetical protein